MFFRINHYTSYTYSDKVFLEPQLIKMTPKPGFCCKVESSDITVLPEPDNLNKYLETDGSICYSASYLDLLNEFSVNASSKVKLVDYNPLNFVIYPLKYCRVPFLDDIIYERGLGLFTSGYSEELRFLSEELALKANNDALRFLDIVNKFAYREINYQHRLEGHARPASLTYSLKKGSCRDKTMLFIELCRLMNIPSRFVSGYFICEKNGDYSPELHAWAEVYVPGGGWIGYDPTNGIMCYGRHVVLTSSHLSELTLPISGAYRGSAESEIYYDVTCEVL